MRLLVSVFLRLFSIARLSFLLLSCLFFTSIQHLHAEENDGNSIRMSIHLLDYIGRDYPMAVEDHKIINEAEYQEMLEFSNTLPQLLNEIFKKGETKDRLLTDLGELKKLIVEKADRETIAERSKAIRNEIIETTGFKITPQQWPNIEKGKELYQLTCAPCHGKNGSGNGILSKNLEPAPTNFLDESMAEVSPFQAYNTIRLGVEGTSMRSYHELSDEEIWNLAFFVKSLRFQKKQTTDSNSIPASLSLHEVATLNDEQLLEKLNADSAKGSLSSIRLHLPRTDLNKSLQLAEELLNSSLKAYTKGDFNLARQRALRAYLEGIEPVEAQLSALDPKFTSKLEEQMFSLRKSIEDRNPLNVVEEEVAASIAIVEEAGDILGNTRFTFWLSFLLSSSILLREGLEAFLIIAVMLTIIRSTGIKKALPWLHSGWIIAVLFGFAGWFASDFLLQMSGQSREIMEGAIALFAVFVLTYMGFWLHNNSHTKKWKDFIENRMKGLLKTENMWGLAIFSFMAVFREAFESVLFLQAIKLETLPKNQSAIGFGVLAAFAIIAVFVWLFLKYSQKIPVRQLFRYSSWMISLLAIILMGKGIHSIQESGLFSVSPLPFSLRVEWLGLFPTLETVLGQLALLLLIFFLWLFNKRKLANY